MSRDAGDGGHCRSGTYGLLRLTREISRKCKPVACVVGMRREGADDSPAKPCGATACDAAATTAAAGDAVEPTTSSIGEFGRGSCVKVAAAEAAAEAAGDRFDAARTAAERPDEPSEGTVEL